jgi:hypothetical protein
MNQYQQVIVKKGEKNITCKHVNVTDMFITFVVCMWLAYVIGNRIVIKNEKLKRFLCNISGLVTLGIIITGIWMCIKLDCFLILFVTIGIFSLWLQILHNQKCCYWHQLGTYWDSAKSGR